MSATEPRAATEHTHKHYTTKLLFPIAGAAASVQVLTMREFKLLIRGFLSLSTEATSACPATNLSQPNLT